MKNFIQKYALAIVAVATIVTFSAYKVTGTNAAFVTTPIYFHGDATDPDQVADESNWTTTPNGKSCNGDNLACMMLVENTDLTGSQLDPLKITLDAIEGASALGYIPEHIGGSGSPNPIIINEN
ncbi:hypothetical protein KO02_21635 [Sphingobacterium sp. ML3W]|uniref:hypothetical protein n=1 Tax=Sphingobacterium sp. ML3W TaxID=1538644 RepID=UPI0004F90C5F|nr:hypothetical protein [Sphingobacterium sp. ML3W]AIM39005.1 hypothetical protein KO02_21635 [Sphingobacterium sp. ML3W]